MSWRRNLFAVTAVTFIGSAGFTLVMPFLPLYFQRLGVEDVGEIALWSGLSLGVTPALTAVLAPFWGRLGDRYGRKIMVERSLASFVVVMAALAFVTRPWHVLALRALQGFFAGYGSLALTMAADSAPRDRMASAIGTVQTAQRLGPAIGPVVGGAIAHFAGMRQTFLIAAGVYVAALLLLFLLYEEADLRRGAGGSATARIAFRNVLAFENFVVLLAVVFALQFVDRSFGPVLPLFVAELGTPPARVPIVAGALFSIVAGAGALGHHVGARLMRTRPARALIGAASLAGALAAGGYAVAWGTGLLLLATPIFGLAIGVATTAAYSAAGAVIPAAARGAGFGLLSTASLAGLALSPVISGFLGATSIRAVFVLDAVALGLLALVVGRQMASPLAGTVGAQAAEEL